jgi:hypothetical protein
MSHRGRCSVRALACTAVTLSCLLGGCGGDEETADSAAGPPPTASVAVSATRSVGLNWAPSTEYEDGAPLIDLAGYRIWYGKSPRNYSSLIEIAPGTTSYTIHSLPASTYYFSITSYNHEGVESSLSNEVAIALN